MDVYEQRCMAKDLKKLKQNRVGVIARSSGVAQAEQKQKQSMQVRKEV